MPYARIEDARAWDRRRAPRRKAAWARYQASVKGRLRADRYGKSIKGRIAHNRFQRSPRNRLNESRRRRKQ